MSQNTYKIGLEPVELQNANSSQTEILERAQKGMGMIPNMYKNMVNLPGLQNTYDVGYNHFRSESDFSPAEQEVVFLTLSVSNACGYCTKAHTFLALNMSKTPEDVVDAILNNKEVPDQKLKALHEFTKIMNESRGNPSPEQAKAFLDAGYSEKQILAIILAQAVKTISNYSNHVFHTEVDAAFSGN